MQYRPHRYPCDHPIELTTRSGRRVEARLANVSMNGARIAPIQDIAAGEVVRLALGTGLQAHEATVRWARDSAIGVRFTLPLSARCLATVRKSGGGSQHRAGPGWNVHLRELR